MNQVTFVSFPTILVLISFDHAIGADYYLDKFINFDNYIAGILEHHRIIRTKEENLKRGKKFYGEIKKNVG